MPFLQRTGFFPEQYALYAAVVHEGVVLEPGSNNPVACKAPVCVIQTYSDRSPDR
jgi:hypothetical protein